MLNTNITTNYIWQVFSHFFVGKKWSQIFKLNQWYSNYDIWNTKVSFGVSKSNIKFVQGLLKGITVKEGVFGLYDDFIFEFNDLIQGAADWGNKELTIQD